MLSAERNNFLAAVFPLNVRFGLAFVDLTTGDFRATELEGEAALLSELERLRPAEIVLPAEAAALRALLAHRFAVLNGYDDWVFAPETAQFTLREHFKVSSLDGFGLRDRPQPSAPLARCCIIFPIISGATSGISRGSRVRNAEITWC